MTKVIKDKKEFKKSIMLMYDTEKIGEIDKVPYNFYTLDNMKDMYNDLSNFARDNGLTVVTSTQKSKKTNEQKRKELSENLRKLLRDSTLKMTLTNGFIKFDHVG